MRRIDHHESLLPRIETYKTQPKPIKDVLKDLQQRKMIIESRLRTQVSSSDHEERDENIYHVRDRIITDVPYYGNKISYYKPLEKTEFLSRIKESPSIEIVNRTHDYPSESNFKINKDKQKTIGLSSHNQTVLEKREPVIKSRKEISQEVEKLVQLVPIDPRERNEKNIMHLKTYLIENNMFFAKIDEVLATCLLKLNRVIYVRKNEVVYNMGEEKKAIYLILSGRVKLYSSDLKIKKVYKVCGGGESIGEEIIFTQNSRKIMSETAKAISGCFLIELKIENYKKMNEEMIKFGYKIAFHEMESIIKRNYITKNWLRSEKERMEGVKH